MRTTRRLCLIPVTAALIHLERTDRAAFAAALSADIPSDWPPELLADALGWFQQQLDAQPDLVGWLGWYGVIQPEGAEKPVLAASGGFMGKPTEGTVEIGYSVLPAYQRRGYASEMVAELIHWAFEQPDVRCVAAEVHRENTPSLRLLASLGFTEVGAGREPEHLRFMKTA